MHAPHYALTHCSPLSFLSGCSHLVACWSLFTNHELLLACRCTILATRNFLLLRSLHVSRCLFCCLLHRFLLVSHTYSLMLAVPCKSFPFFCVHITFCGSVLVLAPPRLLLVLMAGKILLTVRWFLLIIRCSLLFTWCNLLAVCGSFHFVARW